MRPLPHTSLASSVKTKEVKVIGFHRIGTAYQLDDVRDRQRGFFKTYISVAPAVAPAVAPHMRAHMLRWTSRRSSRRCVDCHAIVASVVECLIAFALARSHSRWCVLLPRLIQKHFSVARVKKIIRLCSVRLMNRLCPLVR